MKEVDRLFQINIPLRVLRRLARDDVPQYNQKDSDPFQAVEIIVSLAGHERSRYEIAGVARRPSDSRCASENRVTASPPMNSNTMCTIGMTLVSWNIPLHK